MIRFTLAALALVALALPAVARAVPIVRANPVVRGAVELSPAVSFSHEDVKRDHGPLARSRRPPAHQRLRR